MVTLGKIGGQNKGSGIAVALSVSAPPHPEAAFQRIYLNRLAVPKGES
jgi:hypothetical protein